MSFCPHSKTIGLLQTPHLPKISDKFMRLSKHGDDKILRKDLGRAPQEKKTLNKYFGLLNHAASTQTTHDDIKDNITVKTCHDTYSDSPDAVVV